MNVKLQRLQTVLFQAPEQQIFFGGSCSIGKSYAARVLLCSACMGIPGITTALIRKNYRDILLNHFSGAKGSFQNILKNEVRAKIARISLNPPKIEFKNGSTIYSLSVEREADLDKIQGSEFQVVFIDEACQLEVKHIRLIRSRCRINKDQLKGLVRYNRSSGLDWFLPKLIMASNPIGPSTLWFKENFVDKGYDEPFHDAETGLTSRYIYGTLLDNEYIDAEEYVKNLIGLGDETLMQAFLYGNFDIATDTYVFGKYYDNAIHTVSPFIPSKNSRIYRSMDWGYGDATAVLWYYIDAYDNITVINELVINKTEPEDVGRLINDIDAVYIRYGCFIDESNSFADTQIFAKTTSERSIHDQLKFVSFQPAYKGKGSRVAGLYCIKQALKNAKEKKQEGLFITDNCTQLIYDIKHIQTDKKNKFDADTNSPHDHTIDSLRYFIYRKPNDNAIIKRVVG